MFRLRCLSVEVMDEPRAQGPPASRARDSRRPGKAVAPVCASILLACGVAACGGSSARSTSGTNKTAASTQSGPANAAGQVAASAKQTIVWAIQGGTVGGLGAEGGQDAYEIRTFEQAHPNITIKVQTTSGTSSDEAESQLTNDFTAGDSTPDVIDMGINWGATFGAAHWLASLNQFKPAASEFFPGELAAGTYRGQIYMIPWFTNAEGVYYRKDLVKTAPTTPAQLASDAQAAMKADPSLKEGVAFEGDKYEGSVTVLTELFAAFGGSFDPAHLNTPANVTALQFMHDLIYKYKVSPQAVTSWQETQVQDAYTGQQAAFAINWPYVMAGLKPGVLKETGYIPFPSSLGGTGYATNGAEYLSVNAKSAHLAADWEFIQWLTNAPNQIHRAIACGDPPSNTAAYSRALFSKAPYFKTVEALFNHLVSRPLTPEYSSVSADVQAMISSVLSNQQTPAQALKSAAAQIARLPAVPA
jgi:multiple sugar transport system substrate-binding protein